MKEDTSPFVKRFEKKLSVGSGQIWRSGILIFGHRVTILILKRFRNPSIDEVDQEVHDVDSLVKLIASRTKHIHETC